VIKKFIGKSKNQRLLSYDFMMKCSSWHKLIARYINPDAISHETVEVGIDHSPLELI